MTSQSGGGSGYPGVTSDGANGLLVAGNVHTALPNALLYFKNNLSVPHSGVSSPITNGGVLIETLDLPSPPANQSVSTIVRFGWYRATITAIIQSAGEQDAVYTLADGPLAVNDVAFSVAGSVTAGPHPETTVIQSIGWYLFDQFGTAFQVTLQQSNGLVDQTFNCYVLLEYMGD